MTNRTQKIVDLTATSRRRPVRYRQIVSCTGGYKEVAPLAKLLTGHKRWPEYAYACTIVLKARSFAEATNHKLPEIFSFSKANPDLEVRVETRQLVPPYQYIIERFCAGRIKTVRLTEKNPSPFFARPVSFGRPWNAVKQKTRHHYSFLYGRFA